MKFLTHARKKGAPVRRYQYTSIDDATRGRALKIYRRHTQANAIDFIDYVVKKFPFRISLRGRIENSLWPGYFPR